MTDRAKLEAFAKDVNLKPTEALGMLARRAAHHAALDRVHFQDLAYVSLNKTPPEDLSDLQGTEPWYDELRPVAAHLAHHLGLRTVSPASIVVRCELAWHDLLFGHAGA